MDSSGEDEARGPEGSGEPVDPYAEATSAGDRVADGEEAGAQTSEPSRVEDDAAHENRPWRDRRRVPEPPWMALHHLDTQWEDHTPLAQRDNAHVLLLTTPDDPRGWDYLGALTGASDEEVADACSAWLTAQLAADAIRLGQAYRPSVALVPAGRMWHVVRTIAHQIILIDGPGWPTPYAAARAASRRYRAELLRELERAGEDAGDADDDEIEVGSGPESDQADDIADGGDAE